MKLWSITVLSTCLKDATTCSSTHHDSWLKASPSFLFAWSNNFEYLSVSGGVALMSWGYISPGEASTCGISDLSTQRWRSIDAFTDFYQSWSPLFVGVYLFDIYLIMHGPQLFNTIHRDVYRILILYCTDLYDQFACPVPGAVQPPDLLFTQPNHDQDSCTNRKSDSGATPHRGAVAGFTCEKLRRSLKWRCLIHV